MHRRLVFPAALAAATLNVETARADRAIGIDVSYYQSSNSQPTTTIIDWAKVAKSKADGGGGIQFAFIRSSRGGTTGSSTSAGGGSAGSASVRYDDPYFEDNMAKARANGILTGAYHFTRIDRIHATDLNFPTYAGNTGLDEANHFLQKAGNYMRPGYLRPVIDVESGATETDTDTTAAGRLAGKAVMGAWVKEFSDRILAVTGVRPIVYINTSYATDEIDNTVNIHDLWLARYTLSSGSTPAPTQADANTAAANAQTLTPPTPSGYANPYGVFKTATNPVPWDFWQYTDAGRTPGISGYVDQDVANGDIEYVKDFLVPALWTTDTSDQWTTASRWNSVTYLPATNDRVIISRPASNITVTLASGTQSIRSLQLDEKLVVSGGSLAISQYAALNNALTVNDGTVTAGSIANASAYAQSGGIVTTGAVTGTGSMTVTGGLFRAASIRQNAIAIADGNVELQGAGISVVTALTTGGSGHLDVGTAKFVIDYPSGGSSPLESVRLSLLNGRILTSTGTSAVGVAGVPSTDLFTAFPATFGDTTVDASAVLLLRALKGDATLDGVVNFDDLIKVAQNYNRTGRWVQGDFNYDGFVNFDDLIPLAQNYNAALDADSLVASSLVAGNASLFASDWSLAQSLVPEPTTAIATLSLLGLRRVRRASDRTLG